MSLKAHLSTASDTIYPGKSLAWNQTLISRNGIFELGFFTPGKSQNYYVGIWYKKIAEKTVVWVANRDFPVSDPSSSELQLSEDGNLVLTQKGGPYYKFTTFGMPNSTVGLLLDNGNFILRSKLDNVLWQSFDVPTNTWLPGAKIGYNILTNENQTLKSWTNSENPKIGRFFTELQVEKNGTSHLYLTLRSLYYKVGYKFSFEYLPNVSVKELNNFLINVSYVSNKNESYFIYFAVSPSTLTRFVLEYTGELNFYVWDEYLRKWNLVWMTPLQHCEILGFCGDLGICNQQKLPLCDCPKGFKPRYPTDWDLYDYSGGCENNSITWRAHSIGALEKAALRVGVPSVLTFLIGIVLAITWRRHSGVGALKEVEFSLILFKYRDLRIVTKNFSQKLGEGGFGSVFKGILPNSTAIAVKKIRSLEQGEKQFRAEVSTLGAIQHVNILRLRGFCVEASKRFLIYEYMPKGSLESHLFQTVSIILAWKTRYRIAIGTARGLAYLHENCRDCIIHCDIKPENILLDADYDPKVADFGLAKVIGRDFSRVLTTMRGTRGYLAPEWISGEAVTPKVDVFSYGKLLFEILSGRRNVNMLDDEICNYFPARVAIAMNKGEDLRTFLDFQLEGRANMEELTRACKVACWCIQDDPKDRPTMGQVVKILEGVMQVGIPQIPLYFQRLSENPTEMIVYHETGTSSSSY
jgi:hypothetical protein